MNKRILYLLIALIGLFSISTFAHFSDHDAAASSTGQKVHPTYKTSIPTLTCIDESEVDTSDFDQLDNRNSQSCEPTSHNYSIHYEDFRLKPTSFQNSVGKLFNGLPIYLIFQNFRI